MRFAGFGVADELGPVCASGDRAAATIALRDVAYEDDLLIAERIRSDWPRRPLGDNVMSENDSPVIALADEGGWEPYLAARSSNFRQQVRRRARKLERALEVRYRLADDPDRLDADFDILVALHRARWGAQSSAFSDAREGFHREFAAVALSRGWLRLWLAESQGVPVAAWYGFRFAGVESYYQSGRDPRWDRYAVGAGILEHSIREAFADGMREYRLLRGDESYKRRYASWQASVLTVALAGTARGRALVAGARALAARPRGRRLVSRLAS
jgi:CelD/BcsL family acetyltransferase involved in cellulose biosynthesis